jgi:hypothetical protein
LGLVLAEAAGPARADIYSQTVLVDNPIGYWRLDETAGTTANDSSGNGRNGTYTGGFTLNQPGAISSGDPAVLLNGSGGRIDNILGTAFNLPNNFSVEAWVKQASTNGVQQMISNGSIGFEITNGQVEVTFFGIQDIFTGINVPQDGKFHQVVETVDSTNHVTVYLDWLSRFTSTFVSGALSTSNPLALGALPGGGEPFNGVLDEPAFYNHVLSGASVLAHFQAAGAAAVPEPSPLALAAVAGGACGLASWRRRKRAAALSHAA